jgi:hypothetical protein
MPQKLSASALAKLAKEAPPPTKEELAWQEEERKRLLELKAQAKHKNRLNILSESSRLVSKQELSLVARLRNREKIKMHETPEEIEVREAAERQLRYAAEEKAAAEAKVEAAKPKPKGLGDKLEPGDKAYGKIMDAYVDQSKKETAEAAVRAAKYGAAAAGGQLSVLPSDLRKTFEDWSAEQSSLPKWLQKDAQVIDTPVDIERKPTNVVCPLCTEYMFHPPNQRVCFIACGHGMHAECKLTLMRAAAQTGDAKPICLICSTPVRFDQLDDTYTFTTSSEKLPSNAAHSQWKIKK